MGLAMQSPLWPGGGPQIGVQGPTSQLPPAGGMVSLSTHCLPALGGGAEALEDPG